MASVVITYKNAESIGTYGTRVYSVETKWSNVAYSDQVYAACKELVDHFAFPKTVLRVDLRWYPTLKLNDIITLDVPEHNIPTGKQWQVLKVSDAPWKTTVELREV